MSRARAFAAFWWNFLVGDDWRVAAGIAVALALTALLAHNGVSAWWLMPLAVTVLLGSSLRRATRRRREGVIGCESANRAPDSRPQ